MGRLAEPPLKTLETGISKTYVDCGHSNDSSRDDPQGTRAGETLSTKVMETSAANPGSRTGTRTYGHFLLLTLAGAVSGCGGATPPAEPPPDEQFVRVEGHELWLGDAPYRFVGVNYPQALSLASRGPGGDRARLDRELDLLAERGLTNVRVMAGTEGPNSAPYRIVPALQPGPGRYDRQLLDALDHLLQALRARGMRAVVCLSNFWFWSGGLAQYVAWATGEPIPYPLDGSPDHTWEKYQRFTAAFYDTAAARELYREHLVTVVTRRNRITGRPYAADATIMAWELANEPRGVDRVESFHAWIDETASLLKRLAPHQLVTTGTEGQTPYPEVAGLDFVLDHLSPSIDYATVHLWVENWGRYDPRGDGGELARAEAFAMRYLSEHRRRAAWLRKPVVLEEFGMARDDRALSATSSVARRDTFFNTVLKTAFAPPSRSELAFSGVNVWAFSGEGRPHAVRFEPGDPLLGDPPHEDQGWYSLYDTDESTLSLLSHHANARCCAAGAAR